MSKRIRNNRRVVDDIVLAGDLIVETCFGKSAPTSMVDAEVLADILLKEIEFEHKCRKGPSWGTQLMMRLRERETFRIYPA